MGLENKLESFGGKKVPERFWMPCANPGRLESITYETENGSKNATVYLPFGHNEASPYNILYLMHGALGNETTLLGTQQDPTPLKAMIDNMIKEGLIDPLVIVAPTIRKGGDDYITDITFFYKEFEETLMPLVEGCFLGRKGTSKDDLAAFRDSRAFGGFSAGSVTTWNMLLNSLKYIKYFMPLCGATVARGDGSLSAEKAALLNAAALKAELPFYVFCATGSEDVSCLGLRADILEIKKQEAFKYTTSGFEDGNLIYLEVAGNEHKYSDAYEYVYTALPLMFDQRL